MSEVFENQNPPVAEPKPEKKKRKTKGYIKEVMIYGINEAKWKAAIEFCKDRRWDFKIMTEDHLF